MNPSYSRNKWQDKGLRRNTLRLQGVNADSHEDHANLLVYFPSILLDVPRVPFCYSSCLHFHPFCSSRPVLLLPLNPSISLFAPLPPRRQVVRCSLDLFPFDVCFCRASPARANFILASLLLVSVSTRRYRRTDPPAPTDPASVRVC